MAESSGHSYLRSHDISGETLLLNINDESTQVMKAAGEAGVGRSAKTLVKEGPLRVVIVGLKSGSTMEEHEAGGPVSIHVLSGRVNVSGGGRDEDLAAGRALVFAEAVPHSLKASEDSTVLVTIAWPSQ